jgi:DNA-binding MurR/RpiR family transcriptional regulator
LKNIFKSSSGERDSQDGYRRSVAGRNVRFSAQESRVAAFILKNLSFTASASLTNWPPAPASAATITRFARSVGCEDIRDLRKQLAQASERRASWLAPDSAALPAAWRDALSYLGSTLAQQLAIPRKRRWKSSNRAARGPRRPLLCPRRQDTALASLLQHQLLPAGIAINLCQDASLMRMTASTLSDDHLLLVLVTAEADTVCKAQRCRREPGRHHHRANAATACAGQYGRRYYSPAR